jgi:hypothetical protein
MRILVVGRREGVMAYLLLSPLILATNLIFLLGGEVILDIECLADLFGALPFYHVCDGLAANVEKSLDVEVVCSLEEVSVKLKVGSAFMMTLQG